MTPISLVLAAVGLGVSPGRDPVRARLRWLAAERLSPRLPSVSEPRRPRLHRPGGIGWIVAAIGVLCGLAFGVVPAALALLAAGVLGWSRRRLRAERAADRDRSALTVAVAALIEEYQGGATVAAAFLSAAPTGGRFSGALTDAGALARRGEEPERALGGDPVLAPLAVACALAGSSGASFADALRGVREDLAADEVTRRAVGAAVAGPRSSAILLATLPVVGLAMGVAMGANPGRVLLHTTPGLVALSAGVVLNLAGVVWTLLLTRSPATGREPRERRPRSVTA